MSEPAPVPGPALDRDLYCLTCGYNLRGLSGDPVRCPECGNWNPIGDIELPAEVIRRQLRRMESSPTLCVGAAILGLFALGAFCWILLAEWLPVGARPDFPACCAVPALMVPAAWLYGAVQFRRSCLKRPGWLGALFMYHIWGSLLVVVPIAAAVLGLWGLVECASRLENWLPWGAVVVFAAGIAVYGVATAYWVKWTYRRATGPLAQLQREVAVQIARDQIRRRLALQHRGWFG